MCLNRKRLSFADNPLYIENRQMLTIENKILNPYSLVKRKFNTMLRGLMKELPYFRFYVTEYLLDDISDQELSVQGLFIKVCAYYWFKNCDVSKQMLKQKFSMCLNELNSLYKCGVLKVEPSEQIKIKFLDEQFDKLYLIREKRVISGAVGGSKSQANAKQMLSKDPSYKDKDKDKDKDRYSERFENLWKAGHRPTDSKLDCYDKYKKIIQTTDFEPDFLLNKWLAYVKFTKVEDPELKYIKGFVPWLNKKGWDAEYKIQSTYKPEKKNSGQIEADRVSKLPKKERDEYHAKAEAEFKSLKNKFRESV